MHNFRIKREKGFADVCTIELRFKKLSRDRGNERKDDGMTSRSRIFNRT